MANINFTIDDAKLSKITDAIKGLHPIPQINTGTDDEPIWENEFTDNEWAKEFLRRFVVQQVHRYDSKVARDALNIQKDDSIIS